MKRRSKTLLSFAFVGAALFTFNAHAESLGSKFTDTLVTLRSEVDRLTKALEETKGEQRAEHRALNAQKSDLQIQAQREQAQVKALRSAIERRQSEVDAANSEAANLSPVLLESVVAIRNSVQTGLPFKRAERLADLQSLEKQIVAKTIPETRALSRLWQFVEDEIRLTKENGLYTQPIQLDNNETLAEVARIGMVAMYFRTDDGDVGHVVKSGDSWVYEQLTAENDIVEVTYLFEAFRKQIRAGAFDLPGSLWDGGSK